MRRWDALDSPRATPPRPSPAFPRASRWLLAGNLCPSSPLPEDSAFAQRKERFTSGRKDPWLHGRSVSFPARTQQEGKEGVFCAKVEQKGERAMFGVNSWLFGSW